MSLEPSRLADFRLAGALGSGATARVFDAVHIPSGRPVALKMLEPSARGSELRERFAREALFLAGVQSAHVSRILGYGFDQGQPFLVLERLVGETLDAKLRRDGPVPPALAWDWIEQLLIGVRDIHAANVVHRDLKPANIFIQREGMREVVKVIDFGVARLVEVTDDGSQGLTSASHLIGSVGYMAPEQFANAAGVGPGADLYAVGVVIFRMITGQLPFVAKQIDAVIRMKRERDAPTISSMPGAPSKRQLDWFVAKALSRDLTERFQSARQALDMWLRVRPTFDLEDDLTTTNMEPVPSYFVPPSDAAPPQTAAAKGYVPPRAPPAMPGPPSFQPRSFSPDSFARAPSTPSSEPATDPDHDRPPLTMLSPGQAPQPGRPLEREDRERETDRPPPSSRTGVDHAAPPRPAGGWEVAFDEVPAEPDSEWDDVTQKRKASDFSPAALEAARHAYDQKKNKP